MPIERKWYFELFEFLIVMVILGCMCRIVWIDIYVCFKKKTYKQCSLYLYLVKLHVCRDSLRNQDNESQERTLPLRITRQPAPGNSRNNPTIALETEILPPGEGPPPYDLFSVESTRNSQDHVGNSSRTNPDELNTDEVVIRLPDEEGPPPYDAVLPMGACASGSHVTMDYELPPEGLPLCTANNITSGEQEILPPDTEEGPPPYSAMPTRDSKPSQSLFPLANPLSHHRNRHAQQMCARNTDQTEVRLSTISEETPLPCGLRDYDPQEGTSGSHLKPHDGASKRALHPTTRGRHQPGYRNSKDDVEWYHYSVI